LPFRTKWEATHPDLVGKGETEDWGKGEFPGSIHEGLLVITAIQVNPTRGSTGALEARGDLHFWATGTVKKV
jgi:hypothetical protein